MRRFMTVRERTLKFGYEIPWSKDLPDTSCKEYTWEEQKVIIADRVRFKQVRDVVEGL